MNWNKNGLEILITLKLPPFRHNRFLSFCLHPFVSLFFPSCFFLVWRQCSSRSYISVKYIVPDIIRTRDLSHCKQTLFVSIFFCKPPLYQPIYKRSPLMQLAVVDMNFIKGLYNSRFWVMIWKIVWSDVSKICNFSHESLCRHQCLDFFFFS